MRIQFAVTRPITVEQVAEREGISEWVVRKLLRQGRLIPSKWDNELERWLISDRYMIVPISMGRPPGAKNKRPYPKGVKRPRQPKEAVPA